MKAEILRLTAEGMCESRTENGLLVVFRPPAHQELHLGDMLEFDELVLDADVLVTIATRAAMFVAHIAGRDVHDLRLPLAHGSARRPSEARLRGG